PALPRAWPWDRMRPCERRSAPSAPSRCSATRRSGIGQGRLSIAPRNRRSTGTRLRTSRPKCRRLRGSEGRKQSQGHRVRDRTAVVKRRYARADIRNASQVYLGETDALLLAHVEQDVAPWVDDQAVAERVAA